MQSCRHRVAGSWAGRHTVLPSHRQAAHVSRPFSDCIPHSTGEGILGSALSSPQAGHGLADRGAKALTGLPGHCGTSLIGVSHGADRCWWQGNGLKQDSPRTMVYLSWGEQRPITRSAGHSAVKHCRSMEPSARSTRSLNSGPDITAAPALLASASPSPGLRLPLPDPACARSVHLV